MTGTRDFLARQKDKFDTNSLQIIAIGLFTLILEIILIQSLRVPAVMDWSRDNCFHEFSENTSLSSSGTNYHF